jgi:hypothetical protein
VENTHVYTWPVTLLEILLKEEGGEFFLSPVKHSAEYKNATSQLLNGLLVIANLCSTECVTLQDITEPSARPGCSGEGRLYMLSFSTHDVVMRTLTDQEEQRQKRNGRVKKVKYQVEKERVKCSGKEKKNMKINEWTQQNKIWQRKYKEEYSKY